MKEVIITGAFTILGSIVTFFGTYLINKNAKQQEQNRFYIKRYLEEIKSFYNLEQLYMEEVEKLRLQLPDSEGSKKALGIQKEYRNKNEENGNVIITMTASGAEKRLADLD